MPEQITHPSPADLAAFGLGQLPAEEASLIEQHINECEPCCETIIELSKDDTFVDLLQQAGQASTNEPTDRTVEHLSGQSESQTHEVPQALAEHPRYEIVELIGKGGMGDVYKARHRMMKRTVALKIINRQFVSKPQAVDRFHREVETAAKLSHPNIVTAHDAEQAGDSHFLVMEYVDGVNLAQTVQANGPLPIAEACEYIRQAALGLECANENGMVHRDIKPHNLMLTEDGTVKILDFGLASLAPESFTEVDGTAVRSDLTVAGAIMGTPDYISPEQAEDARNVDIRSDIYSLGATLYYLLSGQSPYAGGSVAEKLKSLAEAEPQSLDTLRKEVPKELTALVEKMLAKDPNNRFQSPAEVAEALLPFANPNTNTAIESHESKPTRSKLGRGLLIAAGLIGILAAISAALMMPETVGDRLAKMKPGVESLTNPPPNTVEALLYTVEGDALGGKTAAICDIGNCRIALLGQDISTTRDFSESSYITITGDDERIQRAIDNQRKTYFESKYVDGKAECKFHDFNFQIGLREISFGLNVNHVWNDSSSPGLLILVDVDKNRITTQTMKPKSQRVVLKGMSGAPAESQVALLKPTPADKLVGEWRGKNRPKEELRLTFSADGSFEMLVVDPRKPEQPMSHATGTFNTDFSVFPAYLDLDATFHDTPRAGIVSQDDSPPQDEDDPTAAVGPGHGEFGETDLAAPAFEEDTLDSSGRKHKFELIIKMVDANSFLISDPENDNRPKTFDGRALVLRRQVESKSSSTLVISPELKAEEGFPTGPILEKFQKDLYATISRAAGMPTEEWEAFAKAPQVSSDLITGMPLSRLLLTTNEPKLFENNFVMKEWPKTRDIQEAMSPSTPYGYVSLIQPEYITKATIGVDEETKLLRGTVSFESPIYKGDVDFAMDFYAGRMKVVEFSLPKANIRLVRNFRNVWIKANAKTPAPVSSYNLPTLQQTWLVVSAQQGSKTELNPYSQLNIQGNRYSLMLSTPGGMITGQRYGTIKTDTSKTPHTIDFIDIEDNKNDLIGIYEIVDGKLRLCFVERKETSGEVTRPEKFESPEGSKDQLWECLTASAVVNRTEPLKELPKGSYYIPEIKSITQTDGGKVRITYTTMPESMWFCPGANAEITERGVELTFVRAGFKQRPQVQYTAMNIEGIGKVIVVDPEGKPIFLRTADSLEPIWDTNPQRRSIQDRLNEMKWDGAARPAKPFAYDLSLVPSNAKEIYGFRPRDIHADGRFGSVWNSLKSTQLAPFVDQRLDEVLSVKLPNKDGTLMPPVMIMTLAEGDAKDFAFKEFSKDTEMPEKVNPVVFYPAKQRGQYFQVVDNKTIRMGTHAALNEFGYQVIFLKREPNKELLEVAASMADGPLFVIGDCRDKRFLNTIKQQGAHYPMGVVAMSHIPLWQDTSYLTLSLSTGDNPQLRCSAHALSADKQDGITYSLEILRFSLSNLLRSMTIGESSIDKSAMDTIGTALREAKVTELSETETLMIVSLKEAEPYLIKLAETYLDFGQAKSDAHRAYSVSNLRQIAQGFILFEQEHGYLPSVTTKLPGAKHPVSWRVAILQYLDEDLYNQYDLDEPWYSNHNKQLLEKLPSFYRHPGQEKGINNTCYVTLVGENTATGNGESPITDSDGARTILVTESYTSIPWTKPEDHLVDKKSSLPERRPHRDGWNVVFVDGSSHFLSADTPANVLEALIKRNGDKNIKNDNGSWKPTGAASPVPTDHDRIQGTWSAVSGMNDGVELTTEEINSMAASYTFDGKTLRIRHSIIEDEGEKTNEKTFHLDPTTNLKQIDTKNKDGNVLYGIYEFRGDKLRICWAVRPRSERPATFEAKEGMKTSLIVLERAKANPTEKPPAAGPFGKLRPDGKPLGFPVPRITDHDRLQGDWAVTAQVVDGVETERDWEKKVSWYMVMGHTVDIAGGDEIDHARFRIDATTTPKTIDLRHEDGKVERGIYEIEGETLRICWAKPGSRQRPTSLESTKNSNTILTTFKLLEGPLVLDRDRLQDTWHVTSSVINGVATEEKKHWRYTFDNNKLVITLESDKKQQTYRLIDSSEAPKKINLVLKDGTVTRGIYEFDGDTMRLCLQAPDSKERPTKFESKPGSDVTLLTLKTVQPALSDHQLIQGAWNLTLKVDDGETIAPSQWKANPATYVFQGSTMVKNDGTEKLDIDFWLDPQLNQIALVDEDWKLTLGSYKIVGNMLQVKLSKREFDPAAEIDTNTKAGSIELVFERLDQPTKGQSTPQSVNEETADKSAQSKRPVIELKWACSEFIPGFTHHKNYEDYLGDTF